MHYQYCGYNLPTLFRIGLTDMPKTGGVMPLPPPPSGVPDIQSRDKVGLSLAAKKFRLMMSRIYSRNKGDLES